MLNRIEKENKVIELYKQDKKYREIAQQVHMSFGDISNTIKKFTGESLREETLSKDTQAIKLFSLGKTPVDVVIELNISADEANRVYRDYWKLKRLYQLYLVYEEIKNNIPSFIKLFRLIKEEGITEDDVLELFHYSNQIPSLKRIVEALYEKIRELAHQKNILSSECYVLQNKLGQSENLLQQYQSELDSIVHKINIKSSYLKVTERSIDDLLNDGNGYLKIQKIAEKKISEILDDKKNLLMASIITALLAIRSDSNKGVLIDYSGYYSNGTGYGDSNNNNNNSRFSTEYYIQIYHQPLLEVCDMLYDKILKTVQNHILSRPLE